MEFYVDERLLKAIKSIVPNTYILLLYYKGTGEVKDFCSEYVKHLKIVRDSDLANCEIKTTDNILYYMISKTFIKKDEILTIYNKDILNINIKEEE